MIGLEQLDRSEVPTVLIRIQRKEASIQVMSIHLLALDPPALARHVAPVEVAGVIGETDKRKFRRVDGVPVGIINGTVRDMIAA